MMRKGSVNKTRRRNSDAEEWHDCMGVPSEYQYITDDNSSPETIRRVNSVRNSAWKAPTQSKAKTTRNREVPPLIYQEHTAQSNEDFNVFLENLETINNANDYENLLTEIYTEKPKRGRKKKSIVTPSSDSLLAVECLKNNEIINNTKVTVKRTNSKLSAVNKPDSIELEEVINTLGNVSQQAGVGDKPKTTYKPRKTKPKDVVDMPVSELLQNENGSSLLNETLTVNKPLKATKPRKSKQNMIFETPLPSECHSTTNMLDAANITENETELKCKGRTSRKREKTDSPSVSKEPSHAECTSLEDESEKIIASAFSENPSSNDSSPISPFSPEIDELNLDNFKWKRKLPEHETSTPKRDKQTGKAPSSATRYRRGVFNITVKKGLPIEVDVNCKIPTYITNSRESRGNVLVISNIQFMDPEKNRKGGDIDHTNITKLFKEMGFTITSHKNKTAKGIKDIVDRYCQDPKLESGDIHITVIMSHGTEVQNKLSIKGTDYEDVDLELIIDKFSNISCHALATKPKIFILQCCRGDQRERERTDGPIVYISSAEARKNSDVLIAYSTTKGASDFSGQVSYRNEIFGSRYIQVICNVFMEHAHDTNIEDLLKIVDNKINSRRPGIRELQTCTYENRGFKRCFLNPI